MRLDDLPESSNVQDRRGEGGFGFGGGGDGFRGGGGLGGGLIGMILPLVLSRFGIGGVVVLGVLFLLFGGLGGGGGSVAPVNAPAQVAGPPAQGERGSTDRFVAQVVTSTEQEWTKIFAAQGQRYAPPAVALFAGRIRSACGAASSASGPFYCPGDKTVYLDTSFFDELASRFGAPGDFAAAYVIAHEVGHHVQTLIGVSDQVRRLQAQSGEAAGNAAQVKMELQADCFAGVWARRSGRMEPGDFEEGVKAAEAIGDDRLTKGMASPDSFTHGTSAQRVGWLTRGYESGDPNACDTFGAARL